MQMFDYQKIESTLFLQSLCFNTRLCWVDITSEYSLEPHITSQSPNVDVYFSFGEQVDPQACRGNMHILH